MGTLNIKLTLKKCQNLFKMSKQNRLPNSLSRIYYHNGCEYITEIKQKSTENRQWWKCILAWMTWNSLWDVSNTVTISVDEALKQQNALLYFDIPEHNQTENYQMILNTSEQHAEDKVSKYGNPHCYRNNKITNCWKDYLWNGHDCEPGLRWKNNFHLSKDERYELKEVAYALHQLNIERDNGKSKIDSGYFTNADSYISISLHHLVFYKDVNPFHSNMSINSNLWL